MSGNLSYHDPPLSQKYPPDNKMFVGEMACRLGLEFQFCVGGGG